MAVPVPGLDALTYVVPDLWPMPPKGARVRVPLGTRLVVGCVVDGAAETESSRPQESALKAVHQVLDEEPFLPATVVDIAVWVGEYYGSGPGDALAMAMPPSARRGEAHTRPVSRRAHLAAGFMPGAPLGKKQQVALEALRASASGLDMADLAARGVGAATMAALLRRGAITVTSESRDRDPFAETPGRTGWALDRPAAADRPLTPEQVDAYQRLSQVLGRGTFQAILLHGVTGSGKTELYLRLTSEVVAAERRVLILVPEIALTPAMVGQFRARFRDRVAIQHSGLADGERRDQWHRIRRGAVDVVVGTRSAVFAPLESVGLIVVDEEHEGSYKQEESPRYHARDVAVVRARMERAVIVLGSATPSLESAHNAQVGRYERIHLLKRVAERPLATVRIVDMRQEYASGGPDIVLSQPLTEALGARLERGEQSLVLLNRRGFATVIFCRQCGASLECPHCSVSLTYHRQARRMRCHYCDYGTALPRRCGACQGPFLEQSGVGTERIEADLRTAFPTARIARVDRDTVRGRGAIARVLASVEAGDIDVVVGTQMIAKGHDFPAVTLVGVISADVGLGLADFRAAERTFQLLTQVVGRAGRGDTPGEAIVQTLHPEHYAVRAAAAQDYALFYEQEMRYRRALRYPPAVSLINVLVKGRTADAAMADALDLATRARQAGGPVSVVGPAPAALARIRNEFRVQFFLKSQARRAMRAALDAALRGRPELQRRVIVDVDPLSVL